MTNPWRMGRVLRYPTNLPPPNRKRVKYLRQVRGSRKFDKNHSSHTLRSLAPGFTAGKNFSGPWHSRHSTNAI